MLKSRSRGTLVQTTGREYLGLSRCSATEAALRTKLALTGVEASIARFPGEIEIIVLLIPRHVVFQLSAAWLVSST